MISKAIGMAMPMIRVVLLPLPLLVLLSFPVLSVWGVGGGGAVSVVLSDYRNHKFE
jgi:hypothetical protein